MLKLLVADIRALFLQSHKMFQCRMSPNTKHDVEPIIELIRIATGLQKNLSRQLSEKEWKQLFLEVEKQAIVGVCFSAIETIHRQKTLSADILLRWYGQTELIKRHHLIQNRAICKIVDKLDAEGLEYRLLKGLGLAQYYHCENNPKLMPSCRTLGDFDIWIKGNRKQILDFANKYGKVGDVTYHHVDAGKIDGVEVELHFHPSCLKNVIANNRMQRWFDKRFRDSDTIFIGEKELHVTSLAFNQIYVLNHIYRHLLYEGVGLRQLLDYYFVIRESCKTGNWSDRQKEECHKLIKLFKMEIFLNAVNWTLLYIFEPEYLSKGILPKWVIGTPDPQRGKVLLNEMLRGGNFGKADRKKKYLQTDFWIKRYFNRIRYDLKFLWQYPEEVLWRPVWFVYERLMNKHERTN